MTPLISFAVTVHNEGEYIEKLLEQLVPFCEETGNEIVVLDDNSDDPVTMRAIGWAKSQNAPFQLAFRKLSGDFAAHKNYLNSLCTGRYIFQIDADEILNTFMLKYISDVVENNSHIDLFLVPRVNTVIGLTKNDIIKWGWRVNEKGWVMFPDYQTRLYRNSPDIMWEGKVHERIVGHKTMTELPPAEEWALIHEKTIERQRNQNELYNGMQR